MSIFPSSSHFVTTTWNPAITAEAGLVPCAEEGIKQIFLWDSLFDLWNALITINPAYSPCAPEFGWKDIEWNPVISHKSASNSLNIVWYPAACSIGANGCKFANSFIVIGINSAAAFNFIVHEPKAIIE